MYTENITGHWSKKSIDMIFKNVKRWDVIKMFKDIPGRNCSREETIHVSVLFAYYFMKSVRSVTTKQGSAVSRQFFI